MRRIGGGGADEGTHMTGKLRIGGSLRLLQRILKYRPLLITALVVVAVPVAVVVLYSQTCRGVKFIYSLVNNYAQYLFFVHF